MYLRLALRRNDLRQGSIVLQLPQNLFFGIRVLCQYQLNGQHRQKTALKHWGCDRFRTGRDRPQLMQAFYQCI
ncbi:MAG: hypothetical protein ACYCPA_02255 [Acidithiobacillus sp.]